jgi:hypothetical protein
MGPLATSLRVDQNQGPEWKAAQYMAQMAAALMYLHIRLRNSCHMPAIQLLILPGVSLLNVLYSTSPLNVSTILTTRPSPAGCLVGRYR